METINEDKKSKKINFNSLLSENHADASTPPAFDANTATRKEKVDQWLFYFVNHADAVTEILCSETDALCVRLSWIRNKMPAFAEAITFDDILAGSYIAIGNKALRTLYSDGHEPSQTAYIRFSDNNSLDLVAKDVISVGTLGTRVRTNSNFYFLDMLNPKTNHLTEYEVFDRLLGLYGSDYTILKKALWYSLIGAISQQKTIILGDVYTDIRFNVMYPMPSGSGKKSLCTLTEEVMHKLGKKCNTPTSTHPEQLVGKVIKRKQGKTESYIENPGYLKDQYIIFDDANILLTSRDPSYEESRRYICRALDPIGRNKIFKRLVDNLPDESLSYEPECTISFYIQPVFIPETVVDSGLMRRFLPIYVRLFGTMLDRGDAFTARLHAKNDREELFVKLIEYYTNIINISKNEFNFTENAVNAISELHRELISIGRAHSTKGRNFTDRVAFSIQDQLIKMGCIQALSACRTEINELDIKLAFMDLFEFYVSTLDYINDKVEGCLDYGERWQGATSTDAKCLEFLLSSGATAKEKSATSIRDYISYIAKIREISTRSAERVYHKHIKKEWIDSEQTGSHDSLVWLAFSPKTKDIIRQKAINLEDTEYYRIWSDLDRATEKHNNTICVPTYPCAPTKNFKDKANSEEYQRIQTQEAAERRDATLKSEVDQK